MLKFWKGKLSEMIWRRVRNCIFESTYIRYFDPVRIEFISRSPSSFIRPLRVAPRAIYHRATAQVRPEPTPLARDSARSKICAFFKPSFFNQKSLHFHDLWCQIWRLDIKIALLRVFISFMKKRRYGLLIVGFILRPCLAINGKLSRLINQKAPMVIQRPHFL